MPQAAARVPLAPYFRVFVAHDGPGTFPRRLFDVEVDAGYRNFACSNYDNCLWKVDAAGWRGWTCLGCVSYSASSMIF